MTVLPQLEHELDRVHGARRRRRHRLSLGVGAAGLSAATAVIVAVVLLLGNTVTVRPHRAEVSGSSTIALGSPPRPATPGFGAPRELEARSYAESGWVYGGVLYVDEQLGVAPPQGLVALDPATGRRLGHAWLGKAVVDDVILAGGSIWVTTTEISPLKPVTTLFRLSPGRLQLRSFSTLPGRAAQSAADGSMAMAAGRLWVSNGGRLIAVSLATGRPIAQVPVPGSRQLLLAAVPGALLVSAGDGGGRAHLQRRDAVSGALLATSAEYQGVTEPVPGGAAGDSLWVSEATGMAGYVQRVDARTLRGLPGESTLTGSAGNGIRARVIDGILWVSEVNGGAALNYCGNPFTGRVRLAMPRNEQGGVFLTADANSIYYVRFPSTGAGRLMAATIGTRCRG